MHGSIPQKQHKKVSTAKRWSMITIETDRGPVTVLVSRIKGKGGRYSIKTNSPAQNVTIESH